jgi:O-acetyl-ADP-ribose deacetylase (regulator of RNase III)
MKNPDSRIQVVQGDITKLEVDAIVNAANTTLLGGGGVDGAIHRAAGPELLAECRTLGGCRPGEAKITRGYRLPARFVIHTVGPVWRGGLEGEPETLANCYRNSLHLTGENEIKTIAFPAISCGAYGFPVEEAASIAFKTTREFLAMSNMLQKVILVVWGEDIYDAYRRLL